MPFFTNASKRGRVRYGDLAWSIDVMESPDSHVTIGAATEVGISPRGYAIWSLKVNGADVPGQFFIVDGVFVSAHEVLP